MRVERRASIFDEVEYAPGRLFRVIRPGMKLDGMKAHPSGGCVGWSQDLTPGDVIECTGFGAGWGSDPGYGVEWTSGAARAAGAFHLDLIPLAGGLWNYHPQVGSVVPVEEEL